MAGTGLLKTARAAGLRLTTVRASTTTLCKCWDCMDRFEFATLKIYEYVDVLFTEIADLLHPEIEMLMNSESHGLEKQELIVLLYGLFQSGKLVAKRDGIGLFTPTLGDIESALNEEKDLMFKSKNTFYGLTSGAIEEYRELKDKYQNA